MLEISKFAFENPMASIGTYGATDARQTDRPTYVRTYERRRRKLRVSVIPTLG